MPVTTAPHPSTHTAPSSALKPIYFWRPHEARTGYLGQWYASPFTVAGDNYATAEMWMMVSKARLFGDEKIATEMLKTNDSRRHRALGREVEGFEGGVWDAHKFEIVVQGNMHKFSISEDNESLRMWLLATGERELVEASPLDSIWGIGFAERDAGANRQRWGQNLLGKALMEVRKRLREEESKRTSGGVGT